MMHSDPSLPSNFPLTKNFNIKMSGKLLENFNIN